MSKKRSHYISRFYLAGFIDPHNKPYVWMYEKGNPTVRKSTAANIAVRRGYYTLLSPEGNKDSEIFENILAKIENKLAPIFRRIGQHQNLSDQERILFAIFLAFTMVRVPNYRENIERATAEFMKRMNEILASHPEGFKSMIKKFEEDTGNKIGMPVEELRKFFLGDDYSVKIDSQFSLDMMPLMAGKLASILYRMNWVFGEATDEYKFLTSDNPVFYCDPTRSSRSLCGAGLLNEDAEVTFPVSKELVFIGTWKKALGYRKLNNSLAKEINHRTVISALRFVFSSQYSKPVHRLVQKHKDSAPKMKVERIGPYIVGRME